MADQASQQQDSPADDLVALRDAIRAWVDAAEQILNPADGSRTAP